MNIVNRYISRLDFEVDKPREYVRDYVIKHVKHVRTCGSEIHVMIKPSFVDAFAGRGLIRLSIRPSSRMGYTIVEAKIIPTSITSSGIYILISIMILWTITSILISTSLNSFIVVGLGWVIFTVVIHLTQKLNSGKLENYLYELIERLKRDREFLK